MVYRAIVPVKSLALAKSRLSPDLSISQREHLVLTMLHHVLLTLYHSEVIERVSVVSADPQVLKQAASWGARPLPERLAGHNPALTAAAQQELSEGAEALLTISADLPLLSVEDVRKLVALSLYSPVVLAPSHEGTGTNAVLMRPPLILPYLFGVGSLQRYQQAAYQQDLSIQLCQTEGLALDVDTIHDLQQIPNYETSNYNCPLTIGSDCN